MARRHCCWVMRDGEPCGGLTRWTMVKDEDGQRRRAYDPYCHGHRIVADRQDHDREEREHEEQAWKQN